MPLQDIDGMVLCIKYTFEGVVETIWVIQHSLGGYERSQIQIVLLMHLLDQKIDSDLIEK